jgi:glutamate--cysteine ligase
MNIAFSNQQERIVSLIRQGETAASDFQVGMEIEHIIVDAATLRSIDYFETGGIEEILKAMLPRGYEAILENERLIGLLHPDYVITLEPGGQLEISIKPCRQLSEIYTIYWTFLDRILPVLHENRQWMLCIGYHPQSSIQEIPFNPKQRYRHMSEYLGKNRALCALHDERNRFITGSH